MEVFEVHITGDDSIHTALVKTIAVDLLRPDLSVLRTEHMTSQVMRCKDYQECLSQTLALAETLSGVVRVKIECPVYAHYIEQSLYIESHFDTETAEYPVSRNQKKTGMMGTERVYDHGLYDQFQQKWSGQILELCLYDTDTNEDADWFSFWKLE